LRQAATVTRIMKRSNRRIMKKKTKSWVMEMQRFNQRQIF
jgi:hypothetical protein